MSNKITINLGVIDNSCFVAMPLSPIFQTEYEKVIRPAIEASGLFCVRGDEIYSNQRIMDDIWHSIRSSRIVLAELTNKNPNVLYEVGLAHAIGKRIIIITRNSDDVPFDLKDLRYLFYDVNDPFWGENLKKGIEKLIEVVLSNSQLEKYLEGISHEKENIQIDLKDETQKNQSEEEIVKLFLKGLWTGKFYIDNIIYHVNLMIDYNDQELEAVSLTTFISREVISTVQQMMTVSIEGNKIFFKGVNYTYLERGKGGDYHLDSYELILQENGQKMHGKIVSDSGFEQELEFDKYEDKY